MVRNQCGSKNFRLMMHVAFATLSFTYPWYRVGEITSSTSSLFNGGKTFMIGPLVGTVEFA